MNRLLIDYWRARRPDILRWIAAILIFALFALFIVGYFDYFFEPRVLCQGVIKPSLGQFVLNSSDLCSAAQDGGID
jgi:hypothetical protein